MGDGLKKVRALIEIHWKVVLAVKFILVAQN